MKGHAPLCAVAERVVPSNVRLEPMASDLIGDVPLPTKIPPRVVELVPPKLTASVDVATAFPDASKAKSDEAAPFSKFQPIVVVAPTFPVASVESNELVSEVRYVFPELEKSDVDAWLRLVIALNVVEAENTLLPEKVLLLERSVELAAPIVTLLPLEIAVPLMVAIVPPMKLAPIDVVAIGLPFWSNAKSDEAAPFSKFQPIVVDATTFPFWSVVRSAEVRPGNQVVPRVVSDDDAFWRLMTLVKVEEAVKVVLPENVLLSERSVDEAAPTVMELPVLNCVPLMVPRVPEMRLAPIVVVATTFPFWSVERIALVSPVKYALRSMVRTEVDAYCAIRFVVEAVPKKPVPETASAVEDAKVIVWSAVQVLAEPRLRPIVRAAEPS